MRAARYALLASALLLPSRAAAQVRAWIDAAGSTARPPADIVDRQARTYGLGGLRLERLTSQSFFEAVLQGGTGASNDDGRWLNAGLYGVRQWAVGRSTLSVGGEGFLLRYAQPFQYTAGAIGLKPRFMTGIGPVDVEAFAGASVGHWSTSFDSEPDFPPSTDPGEQRIDGDLSLFEFGGALGFGVGDAALRVALTASRATNGGADGWYRSAEMSVFRTSGPYQLQLATEYQRYGGGNEFGFAATVQREIFGGAQVHASLVRTVRDPQLSTPGQLGFTLGVSIPVFARDSYRSVVTPVAEVIGSTDGGSRVRFTVRAPGTTRVQLVGSFTNWQPTSMHQDGEDWVAVIAVPAGSHQFAFLLDGDTWFVPDDAPGVVDDGFGRRNATLIVS